MLRLFWKLYWKLSGWKIAGSFPYEYKKMVLAVGPHTSWKDILVGFAARNALNIHHAKFVGKKELFDGPFGWLFKWLGGTPVDRSSKHGMVSQVAAAFEANERFIVGIAPEGTRKKVDKLKSGFYYIAKAAKVPIVPIGLDFENKLLRIGSPCWPGDSEEADMQSILAFFTEIKGQDPSLDLRHLK